MEDKQEWLRIQMSSFKRSHLNDRVTIKIVDEDTLWLSNGWGSDILLDSDDQQRLYRAITDHQGRDRTPDCPDCGQLLDCDWYCENCDLTVERGGA